MSAAFPRWMRAVRPAGNFRESGVPALDGRLRAAAVRHGVPALPGAEMRIGDADDGTSGGVFGADERGQGLSVSGDGRADGHDGAGAAFVDLRRCAGWCGGLAVVSREPGRTGAAGASGAVFGAGGFGAIPVGLGGGGGAGGAAGDCHAGCVPVGRGFAAKSMAGLSVSPAIDLYIYHQHPAVSRGQFRLNFAVAEVSCPARRSIIGIIIRTVGIDEQHTPAALLRLFRVFVLDGAVPFIGAVVAPDGPEHHIGVECVHFFGSAVRPEVAAQPDGEGFAAIGEFLEVRALAVVGIRLSVVLPADADAAEAVDDFAVRADEGAAAVQGIPVALDEAEGDSGGVLSGSVLQLADGGGIKRESHIAVSGIRPAQAVKALEGGFAEHNEVGTISGGLGEGSGHRGEVMRNVFVLDGGGGEGDLHRYVSSIRGECGYSVAPIWRDNVQGTGSASWGARLRTREVTGRDASLPAPLWAVPFELVARATVGALPQTPAGAPPLHPARDIVP